MATGTTTPPEPITVSRDGRFLATVSGAPFFWLGDTAWELFHRLNREEACRYLDNRQARGFNVIQAVILAENDGLHTPNPYGHLPLVDDDPLRLNPAYFQHVDFIIDQAAARGLYVGLLPTWGDKVNLMWGVGPVIFNPENAFGYGRLLATRYQDRTNILWVLGGDRDEITDGVDYAPVWRAMAEGIRSVAGASAFMTYHPRGGRSSAMTFHTDEWLTMNMWQSGHLAPDVPNWEQIAQDYARLPVKPVLDGEPNYEDHPINPYTRQWEPAMGYFSEHDARKQAYRAVFAGACGHTYGHHSIWQMYAPGRPPCSFPAMTWDEAILRPGGAQMVHLKRLMLSRPYWSRIPDQVLLASGEGEGARHVRATRDAGGSYALIYIPEPGQTVSVSLRPFAGKTLHAWWYDPRSGFPSPLGVVEAGDGSDVATFTTPEHGPDWVLVLDDTAQQFPLPGHLP